MCNCCLFSGVCCRPQSQPYRASRMALQQATTTLPCQCRRSRLETLFSFRKGDRCERKTAVARQDRTYVARAKCNARASSNAWVAADPRTRALVSLSADAVEKKKPDEPWQQQHQQRSRRRSSPPRAGVHVRQRWGNRQTHHAGVPSEPPASVRGKTASAAAHALGTDVKSPWSVVETKLAMRPKHPKPGVTRHWAIGTPSTRDADRCSAASVQNVSAQKSDGECPARGRSGRDRSLEEDLRRSGRFQVSS
jgi:hypothetical protein